MSYKALLFCPEEKIALVVTQVLTELDFQAEPCNEVFTAVKKLTSEHFDAVVVDCDNEQNAGLLFKSASHSGSNQQSLAVAIVEDQNGVAAAFRLGANLVLTKPISLEQSRSTLRTARGLLRKNESGKSSTATLPITTSAQFVTATPTDLVGAKPMPSSAAAPVFSAVAAPAASIFEVEKEPEQALEPGEAALLESMSDPLVGKTFAREPGSEKGSPWPTAARTTEPEIPAARPRAMAAAAKPEAPSPTLVSSAAAQTPTTRSMDSVSRPGPSAGAAAAPARAKQPVRIEEPENFKVEPPTFSYGSEPTNDGFGGEGKRKLLWIAASALVVAAIGYAGWSRLHSVPAAPALAAASQSAARVQPDVSAARSAATTDTDGSDAQPSANKASVVQTPDITLSTEDAPTSKIKPARSAIVPRPAKAKPAPAAEPRDVLVVTNPTAQPAPPPAPAAEPETPAPAASEIAANSGDRAISGIMASASSTAVEPAHSIQLSQGVAQGLLVKQVQPLYPDAARHLRLEGAVQLLANISKDGNIMNLKQLSGDRILGRAAMDAVKQWKYKPYLLDGQPVDIQTQITVNFKP